MLKRFMAVSFLAIILMLSVGAEGAHAQTAGQDQAAGQEVCAGTPSGIDVFSVGEVRTSILGQTQFQELNGSEWVLMDGRPLLVRTALSPHLTEEGEHGPTVPDARGRFLRMANNNACADFRADNAAYDQCIANHDPDGDRLLGTYQPDAFRAHQHGYNDIYFSENAGDVDIGGNGRSNSIGNGSPFDHDNAGYSWDRGTENAGSNETRSKNIAVNFYIKICNCRAANCR